MFGTYCRHGRDTCLFINMILKTLLFLMFIAICECALFSSFWAPLFDPNILEYRVDVKFDPNSGDNARELYRKKNGFRGETLIADLGNGKEPSQDDRGFSDVHLTYTYLGAYNAVQ